MNSRPLISVVTASRNYGAWIDDAILSVCRQGYEPFEHIVVDACSDDGTIETLKTHAHLRWTSEPDEGQSDAINKGFKAAAGDWVGWLNADDYYLPGAFESVVQYASQNPAVDIIHGYCIFVDHDGLFLRAKVEHEFDFRILLHYGCYIPSTATFFRRRVIDDGCLLDPDFHVCMDFDYFVRLAGRGYRFGYLNRPMAAFRRHQGNRSLDAKARRRERIQVQRNWAGPSLPEAAHDLLSRIMQGKRVAEKLRSGGLWTEYRLRRQRQRPTAWFRSAEASRFCEELTSGRLS